MKKIPLSLFLLLTCLYCSNEKVIHLPEVNHARIHEITDVSPAYLFYNQSFPDSLELNRKNLISTTNWLVNVDKRLSLKQVVPKLKFIQDKKESSSHKKEGVKNYFTCNNTSTKNLGFIDFTSITYYMEANTLYNKPPYKHIVFNNLKNITITPYKNSTGFINTSLDSLLYEVSLLLKKENTPIKVVLKFNQNLNFQDYISIKSTLENLKHKNLEIVKDEFIFN